MFRIFHSRDRILEVHIDIWLYIFSDLQHKLVRVGSEWCHMDCEYILKN